MKLEYSRHALERMIQREITKSQVLSVVKKPDKIIKENDYYVYQSLLKNDSGKEYLLRVFLNEEVDKQTVITVYKTSKVDKYL